jgi:hypothetical protein
MGKGRAGTEMVDVIFLETCEGRIGAFVERGNSRVLDRIRKCYGCFGVDKSH